MHSLVLALLAVGLSACAPDAASEELPLESPYPDTLVVSEDPELAALAREMLPELTERSGLELVRPVRLERRSRAQLEAYLRYKLDQELPEERARDLTAAYGHLGLMPDDVDLRSLLLAVYREQVAGFYDPDSTALFVLEDQGSEALRPVLLHELVHAVQDQAAELDALTDPEVGNDRATAAQAAIEGHATLVMMESMTAAIRGEDVDLTEVPGFADQIRTLMGGATAQFPELARAPRIIREGMLLPYVEGAGFVLQVWEDRGRDVTKFTDLIPSSTEQVLHPSRFLSDPRDGPTEIVPEISGVTLRYDDVLGAAETRVLLEERAGTAAGDAARGWDGDRFLLLEGEAGETLVWYSVWDDVESRDRFVETLRPALDPEKGEVLESVALDGRPGARLRVGPPQGEIRIALEDGR